LHVLPLCNELLCDNLNGLYLCDNCDLLCCYLFHGLCGQVREFVLCFCLNLFVLSLYSGQVSNNPYCFFLPGSEYLLKDLLLVPQSLHFDICLPLSQNCCHSLDWWRRGCLLCCLIGLFLCFSQFFLYDLHLWVAHELFPHFRTLFANFGAFFFEFLNLGNCCCCRPHSTFMHLRWHVGHALQLQILDLLPESLHDFTNFWQMFLHSGLYD